MISVLPQWVKGSGVTAAEALIQSLAWELPYTMDVAIKKKKKATPTPGGRGNNYKISKEYFQELFQPILYFAMYGMLAPFPLSLALPLQLYLLRVQSMLIIHCSRNLKSKSDHTGLKEEGSHRVRENRNVEYWYSDQEEISKDWI